ncbi:MAG TPA: hypothetical protein VL171_10845 [Verrucomicrobiae bacterium]|nr:hypothetical protein [Verrucomicrobiae bacterium]
MSRFRILGVVAAVMALLVGRLYADTGSTASSGEAAAPAGQSSETVWPIQLALAPDVQLVNEDKSIQGFRLNIYGRNYNVTGVDIGLIHETKADFRGVSFGLVSIVHGTGRGLQFSGLYSEGTTSMSGLQVGMVNRSNSMHGLQIGLANFADDMTGIQIGLWNEIKNKPQWNVIPIINAAF